MYVNLNAISFIVTVTMNNYFSRCHVAKKTLCCSSMQLFDVVVTISNTLRKDIILQPPSYEYKSSMCESFDIGLKYSGMN